MSPEKPKSGVIGALSRILHLHQLPDTPPSTLTPVTPAPRPVSLSGGEPTPALPPAYAGKPYVIPEARRTVMPASTIPSSRTAVTPTPARVEPLASAPTSPRTTPAITPVRPSPPKSSTSSSSSNSVWPFPAPWIKSNPSPSAVPPTPPHASTPLPSAPLPASKPSAVVPKPLNIAPASPPKSPVTPVKFPAPSARSPTGAPSPVTATASTPARTEIPIPSSPNAIVTNFDRILDIVRLQKSIKLDELTKRLAMSEEKIAEELQTLEDNGLIEVRYPAFGEPIIYFKNAS